MAFREEMRRGWGRSRTVDQRCFSPIDWVPPSIASPPSPAPGLTLSAQCRGVHPSTRHAHGRLLGGPTMPFSILKSIEVGDRPSAFATESLGVRHGVALPPFPVAPASTPLHTKTEPSDPVPAIEPSTDGQDVDGSANFDPSTHDRSGRPGDDRRNAGRVSVLQK